MSGYNYSRFVLPEKLEVESFAIGFNFGPDLEVGETVDATPISVDFIGSSSGDTTDLRGGDPQLEGAILKQFILSGGTPGTHYYFRAIVNTSLGKILALECALPVAED